MNYRTDDIFMGFPIIRTTSIFKFFERQALGKNNFMSAGRNPGTFERIEGNSSKIWITNHGLRRALPKMFSESEHAGSSVSFRTRHKHPRSFQRYQH